MFVEDLAWAAGFFDAEGCFSSARRYPIATLHQVGLELIDRFIAVVDLGEVYGPIQRDAKGWHRRPQWRHQIFGFEDVQAFTSMLWPWLSAEKRAKAVRVLLHFHSRRSLAKPLGPALGSVPWREQMAWAAGFFDGDGCFSKCGEGLNARITHTNKTLLEQFQQVVRIGKIYGPYRPHHTSVGRKDHFVYTISGFERVQALLALLWYQLGSAKRLKAIALLNDYRFFWKCGHRRGPVWKDRCPQCSKKTGPKPGPKRRAKVS